MDARAATRAHWTEPGKKGVFAYVDDAGRPRGFLLWGIFGRVDTARELIPSGSLHRRGRACRARRLTRVIGKLGAARRKLAIPLRDPARGVRRPAQRDAFEADVDVGMVVLVCASVATRWTNAIASRNPAKENSRVSAESSLAPAFRNITTTGMPQGGGKLRRSRKRRQGTELLCEWVFRAAAHVLVLVLARASRPAAGRRPRRHGHRSPRGLRARAGPPRSRRDPAPGEDGAGQCRRATGSISRGESPVLGRYLDSESDLFVDAALLAALGSVTGEHGLSLAAFVVLTLVLGIKLNVERLFRRERGAISDPMPAARGIAGLLERVYGSSTPRRTARGGLRRRRLARARAGPEARLAYHDRWTVAIIANFGLSTQLAALGLCLALGRPAAYLWLVLGCGLAVIALAGRRELLLRRALPVVVPGDKKP